ncbi:MAG TPA: sensor histidine kinase [Micromonosporaceae bacterium]
MTSLVRRTAAVMIVGITTALFLFALAMSGLNRDTTEVLPNIGVVAFAVVGALILVRRPENPTGALLCGAGLSLALLGAAQEYARQALIMAPGSLPGGQVAAYLTMWLPLIPVGLLVGLLPQIFPAGKAISPRWRFGVWTAWVYTIASTIANALYRQPVEGLPGVSNPYPVDAVQPYVGPLIVFSGVALVVSMVSGLVTLVRRWRRAIGDERQQLKWFALGVLPLLVPILLHDTFTTFSEVAITLLLPLVPVAFGVAILRYRLYDLDVVLNRAIVYASLSLLVALVYLGLVTVSELVIGVGRGLWVQALATVLAAATFQPARARIQRAVDTLFYGDRSRPYEALSRLGVLLEHAPQPDTVLPGVVESVAVALRLPYAAIDLREGDGWLTAAGYGERVADVDEFPMVYQDEVIGRLVVGRRGTQRFRHTERRLLADLARQAGVAAHAVQLTLALQRSRAALVTAREEERRRLRRDLHDGLGPALAGVTLGLHGAAANVRRDPDHAVLQLAALQDQVHDAVADIRRLVYGLRPPALDELGLAPAIRREAARLEGGGLVIAVEVVPDELGPLPAAVEAAAYRIASEALTNVSRHAAATRCVVRLSRGRELAVEVRDDGCGPNGRPGGVGLAAMRERAAELGGTCRVDALEPGTRVLARLPIVDPTGQQEL